MKGTRHSEEQIIAFLKQGRIDDGGVMPTAGSRSRLLPRFIAQCEAQLAFALWREKPMPG